MRFRNLILLGVLLLQPTAKLWAQEFNTDFYTEQTGLPATEVYDIAQDSRGRIILGTRNHIAVYDGVTWDKLEIVNLKGYVERSPIRLFVDSRDHIWFFGTHLRLYHYDGYRWFNWTADGRQANDVVRVQSAAMLEHRGQISAMAFGSKSLYYYDPDLELRLLNSRDAGGSFHAYSVLAVDSIFVVGTEAGLKVLYEGRWMDHPLTKLKLPGNPVLAMTTEKLRDAQTGKVRKRIWLVGSEWVAAIEDNRVVSVQKIPRIISTNTIKVELPLSPDGFGGLFIGTSEMVYWLQADGSFTTLGTENGLQTNGANAIYLDHEKNVWIANNKGLTKITGFRFFNYRKEQGLFNNDVSAIELWKDDTVLLGHQAGLTLVGPEGIRTIASDQFEDNELNRVMDLDRDDQGRVWIAWERRGLFYLDPEAKLHKVDFPEETLPVLSVAHSPRGLLVGTSGRIYIYEDYKTVRWLGRGRRQFYFRKIEVSKANLAKSYLGFPRLGIGVLEGDDLHTYMNNKVPNYNNTYSIVENNAGEVIVASGGGLLQFDDANLAPYRMGEKTIDDPCFLLIEDADNLWVGTEEGVYYWDTEQLRHFSLSEGLAGYETNRDAGYVDAHGRVWIGTSNGLSIYHPEYDMPLEPVQKPRILSLAADSVQLPIDDQIRLPRGLRSLQIRYEFISFRSEDRIEYSQRLIDGNGKLVVERYSDERDVVFGNLDPGSYRFELRARVGDNPWSEPAILPEFIVPATTMGNTVQVVSIVIALLVILFVILHGPRSLRDFSGRFFSISRLPRQGLGLLINSSGTILYLDDELARWMQTSEEKLTGRSLEEIIDPDEAVSLMGGLRTQILEGRRDAEFEARFKMGDSKRFRGVELHSRLVRENEIVIGQRITLFSRM